MARYVNNISEIILDAVDIQQVISEYVELKRAGSNIKGLCPFHNEKTPSFVVSSSKELYHCFGCGAAGNAIGFVMNIENLDFLDAIEFLADKFNIDLEPYIEVSINKNNKNKNDSSYELESKDTKDRYFEVTKHAARFFYSNLKKSEVGMNYFKGRDISDVVIKTFGLGYANDEWNELLNYLSKPPFSDSDLEKVGLIIAKKEKNGYYDRFRGRVIFPIIDVRGRVVGFGGRILTDGQPKYLNSPETPIFNKSNTLYNLNLAKNELSDKKTLIVVEGYMDVIALYKNGIKNVVATLGTALTKSHGKLLKRYADEVIIAYDSDEAGQKATARSVEILESSNLTIRILQLSDGLDPDDFIKKFGKEKFIEKINNSISYIDYRLFLLREKHNLDYEEERIRFVESSIEILKNVKDIVRRDNYSLKVSKWARVNIDSIKNSILKKSSNNNRYNKNMDGFEENNFEKQTKSKKRNKLFIIETRIMYLSLLNRKNFDKIFELISFDDIQNKTIKKVMKFLIGYYQVVEKFKIEECIDHLEIDEITFIQKVLKHSIDSSDDLKEIAMNAKTFKNEVLNNKIIKLMNLIMKANESDYLSDDERELKIKELKKELVDLKEIQKNLIKELGR